MNFLQAQASVALTPPLEVLIICTLALCVCMCVWFAEIIVVVCCIYLCRHVGILSSTFLTCVCRLVIRFLRAVSKSVSYVIWLVRCSVLTLCAYPSVLWKSTVLFLLRHLHCFYWVSRVLCLISGYAVLLVHFKCLFLGASPVPQNTSSAHLFQDTAHGTSPPFYLAQEKGLSRRLQRLWVNKK